MQPRWAGRSGNQPGEDAIDFDIPPETPEGCFVPIRVRTANQLVRNTVTIPVSVTDAPTTTPPCGSVTRPVSEKF